MDIASVLIRDDYDELVRLYSSIGDSEFLKVVFETKTKSNHKRVREELKQLLKESNPPEVTVNEVSPTNFTKRIHVLYDKQRFLHGSMCEAGNNELRKKYLDEIKEIDLELSRVYDEKAYFEKHGFLPLPHTIEIPKTSAQLVNKRNSLRVIITNAKKKNNLDKVRECESAIIEIERKLRYAV